MRRGLLNDAYRTRSACLRWNHARLPGQVAQSGNSEPAVERTKPAELSRNPDPKHRECGVRVDQMRRGLLYDAYRTRSACLRWNHARLPGQVAQSGNSELAVERTKPAELSRNTDPRTMNAV